MLVKIFIRTAILIALLPTVSLGDKPTVKSAEREAFFEKRVRPVLVEHCFSCHSKGAKTIEANLRLDSRKSILRGGDTGPAITKGNDDDGSLLIQAIRYNSDVVKMPPKGKLPAKVIADLEQWVKDGAFWPEGEDVSDEPGQNTLTISDEQRNHWSFQPIRSPTPPKVKLDAKSIWTKNNIDRFVAARLQAAGLEVGELADKRTLIRRATFDLTGLPPTPQEIDDFVLDESDDAFAKVVDRLLDSPRYGERWGRHWLDGVRYVQEVGWYTRHDLGGRYRDWVIASLNNDMPYDQFVKYQIAGDLMPNGLDGRKRNPIGIIATGVLAMGNYDDQETEKETLYSEVVDDQIDLVSRQIMGLTISCARCHDHKFDPISTKDYYALAGIFHSCRVLAYKRIAAPRIEAEVLDGEERKIYEQQQTELKKLEQIVANSKATEEDRTKAKSQLAELRSKLLPAPGKTLGVAEGGYEKGMHTGIGDAYLYIRGNYKTRGPKVPRRFPVVLAGNEQTPLGDRTKQSGRLELAEWLVSKDHPLTARVIANRVWLYHFGEGLVRSPSNFGLRGERPTHPDLLDYLASRLMKNGWSLKKLHREIMLSATYRQTSKRIVEQDPENRLFSRFPIRRLSAEEIYDSLLAVSGKLSSKNRAIYQPIGHEKPWYFGRVFDAAPVNTMIPQRSTSTVAPQALYMMNDKFVIEAAKSLASKKQAIESVFPLLYGRDATDQELQLGREFVSTAGDQQAWMYYQVLLCANEFIYVD